MVIATVLAGVLALATALPLVWKWQLGLTRSMGWMLAFALASGAGVWAIAHGTAMNSIATGALVWLLAIMLGTAAVLYRFYSDPERFPPAQDNVVVSPADGEVVYVRSAQEGLLPVSTKRGRDYPLVELTRTPLSYLDAIVIGIGLSLLDVHVNRSPIAGRVVSQRRYPGRFGSLRRPEMVFENERSTLLIEREGLQVGVVMIASRLVRRIIEYVREGETVGLGQRIGMIRFGSQVDLVLPARDDLAVTVQPGDRVLAGESIVAVLQVPDETSAEASAELTTATPITSAGAKG